MVRSSFSAASQSFSSLGTGCGGCSFANSSLIRSKPARPALVSDASSFLRSEQKSMACTRVCRNFRYSAETAIENALPLRISLAFNIKIPPHHSSKRICRIFHFLPDILSHIAHSQIYTRDGFSRALQSERLLQAQQQMAFSLAS